MLLDNNKSVFLRDFSRKFRKFQEPAYKTRYIVTQYNDMYYRISVLKKTLNPNVDIPKSDNLNIIHTEHEEVQRISISRTIRSIRDYAFSNPFTYFATVTVNSQSCDRFSLEDCQNKLKKILKSIKRKNPNFIYLFLTEKHKNGAFHFHGLISEIPFYINDNGYFSSKDFDKLGFNSFSKIKDFNKTCNYILKYVTKDFIRNDTNQIYIASRGLKRPDRYELKNLDNLNFVSMKKFENNFIINYDCYNSFNFLTKGNPLDNSKK